MYPVTILYIKSEMLPLGEIQLYMYITFNIVALSNMAAEKKVHFSFGNDVTEVIFKPVKVV